MNVLLTYAAADGREPAARLAEILKAMGITVVDATADVPAPQAAGVIAVLTPAALADRGVQKVLREAPAQGRPLLPLSVPAPAAFPTPTDVARLLEWRGPAAAGPKYHVVTAVNSAIGDHAVTVNVLGAGAGWSAAETAQLVAALRSQQVGAPISAQELRQLFAGLQAQVQQVDHRLQQGFLAVLGRFDLTEQRILSPILARLNEQETALTTAILGALETRTFPADELSQHLAAIHLALAEINARAAQIADRQLAEAARQVAEIADDPGLDVKHKLKVTIPIVPLLLNYEGELGISSRLNLRKAWEALRGWVSS